ncbi:unnamed protein product [Orchesella dallaii]|uniref:Cytochrome P450 4C1 n=1 Tax=Orchesella dallaii TaxID=48710 RepID=A0ABP1Q359_9HEXA
MDFNHFNPEECIWYQEFYFQSNKSPEKAVVTAILLLLLLFIVVQLAVKKFIFGKEKSRLSKKYIGAKINQWDKLPRFPLLKLIWLCRDQKSVLETGRRLAGENGPFLRVTVLGEEYLLLNNPDLAEKILSSRDFGHIIKPPQLYEPLFDLIGHGLLTSNGEAWHSKRKIMTKAFTYPALKRYTKIYNKCAKRTVAQLTQKFRKDDKEYHQINAIIQTGGIEIISETVLGLDVTQHKEDAKIMFTSVNRWKEITFQRFGTGWLVVPLFWRWSSLAREYYRRLGDIDNVIKRMIKRCRDELTDQPELKLGGNNANDSFDNMMQLMIKSDFSELIILDEVKTMIMAGYETVSATIHVFLFMLALHQTHQASCREEVDRIFDDPANCANEELTMEALSEMKYLERCLLESMRMFPIVFITARKLEAPLNIDDNLEIPIGTTVVVPNILLHKSPIHFPQPDEFQPDRFLPENCAKRHAYTYLPFSAGPRGCLGIKFSLLEAKTIVAHILRNFEIYTNDKIDDVPMIPSILLRPQRDFYFRLEKRNI